jgi:radical SAM superfamily enzyme YgiQ (UPF0313 family)
MKVTLIQPYYFNIWESLGLAYIAAFAKKHYKGKLEINFYQGYFDNDDEIIQGASASDLIAFSCTSPAFKSALSLSNRIKQNNPAIKSVFGGFHPSAVPDDCLEEEGVDQVVVGEGEHAFLSILEGNSSPIVLGSAFKEFGIVFPDRDIIKNERTVKLCFKQIGIRSTSFQSVRVCPFRCAFCSERAVTGIYDKKLNPVRQRDPGHLLDEIIHVSRKYSLDYFKFVDATWNTSNEFSDNVVAFCEEKMKRNFNLPWDANIHASFATKEMLKIMKAAGCKLVNVGCESGSQRILNDMKKGLTVDKIKSVFKWGREVGLERRGFFLLGMPNETMEDIKLTETLVEEIQPEIFGMTILCPYPGSDLYDPKTMKDYDWTTADEYSNPYWKNKHFTNPELKQIQKMLTDKFKDQLAWHHKVIEK